MTTLREILGRESERSNLWNVGACVAAVLALLAAAFVIAYTDFSTPTASDVIQGERAAPSVTP